MRSKILLLPCLLLLSLLAPAQGNTWYVDQTAPPGGDGSIEHPFTTIHGALTHAATVPGPKQVLVLPGEYVEPRLDVRYNSRLASTDGPMVTRIHGTDLNVAVNLADSLASLEGFTIIAKNIGVGMWFDCYVARCIIIGPGPQGSAGWARGIEALGSCSVEHCVVSGFATGFDSLWNQSLMRNSIGYDNGTHVYPGTYTFQKCMFFQGVSPSPNAQVVVADPMFWDAAGGDFHLLPGSPAIDAGSGLDPDGSPADIGAIPYDPGHFATYCVSTTTGSGCTPTVSASGTPSVTSGTPFSISAVDVPVGQMGKLIYSLTKASTPFQGGTLCLAPPIFRTTAMSSGSGSSTCAGSYSFDFNAHLASPAGAHLAIGQMVNVQFHFRDPLSAAGFGTGLTNALRFVVGP